MSIRHSATMAAVLAAAILLSGCENREERAERFYRSAMQLLEAGDQERALVEFRNVFDNDGSHKEARLAYADLQLSRGDVAEAYKHYLLFIEQQPDTPEVRRTLAEVAIAQGNWEEAKRHGQEAMRLDPDNPAMQAIGLALRYRDASLDRDDELREEAAREARILLAAHDDLEVARRIVIDWLISGPNPQDALPEVERALADEPDSLEFHFAKLRLQALAEDEEGIAAHLREMYARFPDNEQVRAWVIQSHLARNDLDGAEAVLRDLAGEADGPTDGHVVVIQFLQSARSVEAAQAEIDRLIAANEGTANADLYRALKAGIDFDAGRQAEAVAAIEAILDTAEPSDQTRRIKTTLARMLSTMGNNVGARSRVEEVLAEDGTNVEALKMRAAWAIREDRPGDAIIDLRTALSQSPDNVEVLTLMAEAHERDGSLELASERLAAATEASGSAPEPSLRYARFLQRQDQAGQAETVLEDARSASPTDVRVALALAQLRLQEKDSAGVREVVAQLEAIGTDEALDAAKRLEAGLLFAQDRTEDGLAMLKSLASEGGSNQDVAVVVQAMLAQGGQAAARDYLDAELSRNPDEPQLRLIDASLRAASGEMEEAEALLRELVDQDPAAEGPAWQLYTLLDRSGRFEEASAVLDAVLAAQPESRRFRWVKAGELERAGDMQGAIALYEGLYEENTSDMVVANNLASLLSQQSATPEDVERAFAIARRLRGTDQPPFQDTYGWLLSQRGDHQEALTYLEPAAEALVDDPVVQFHLGMTYHALGRYEEARDALSRAVEVAGNRPLPQVEIARATLAEIEAGAGAPSEDTPPASSDIGSEDEAPDPSAGESASTPAPQRAGEAAP